MPEKGPSLSSLSNHFMMLRPSPVHQWRLGILTAIIFTVMVIIWSIDGRSIPSFVESWRFTSGYRISLKVNASSPETQPGGRSFPMSSTEVQSLKSNATEDWNFGSAVIDDHNLTSNATSLSDSLITLNSNPIQWIGVELPPNFTSNLLEKWLAPGGEPCKDSKTVEISIPMLDGKDLIELPAGEIHEFVFHALNDSGKPVCIGGDYFETDLSNERWKSRPPVKDLGDGSYTMSLQVHPDFSGDYNLTVGLLFRHFEGLKFSPKRFAFDRELRRIKIRFLNTNTSLPELKSCRQSDFTRDVWSGRWTRHGKNDDCQISNDGRYRCLSSDFPCQKPWCNGSLGALESNGWVYSVHCSFRLFPSASAWNCLKNRWIFFWGDSNHVDSIRNLLNFVLDLPGIRSVPRRFDAKFSNPKDPSQILRITSIFNGHSNETKNYEGLDSLRNEEYRNLVKKYFSGNKVPDTVIINSGLHDGVHFHNVRGFTKAAKLTASFWKQLFDSIVQRGLTSPKVIYRNTIATGGYARALAFNPNKIEAFNGILLETLKNKGLVSLVIDNFDMTFPWHFDNRCNDGVHYGRAPAKAKWRDGGIGHQYFVDLMLVHILLNALCSN